MPTLLRMPDELYAQELPQVVAPQYAFRTFQDALNGRPFHDPGFRSQVLEFLVRNYRAPAHLIDDAFHALVEDLQQARVLMLERMPMIRAYHWQPGTGEEKGRWVVPTYIFAEHRHMLQLALDNAKSDVPNVGIHEPQEKPAPKVPYRKASSPAPASLKPGADLVDKMAKHSSGEQPLSPEESIQLRKDLGKMNEKLSPGEQFMVPDYSPEEQTYQDEKNQKFANDIAMSYSVPSALLGVPTRGLGGSESQVAGAVNAGLALEGVGGAAVIAGKNNTNLAGSKPPSGQMENPGAQPKYSALQRLAEALRYRQLGWNHEQAKFSKIETMGVSRAEKAFGKKFQPSDIEGVDFLDPGGWGKISLKGPFLNGKMEPLTNEQQLKAIESVKKHVDRNKAVNIHIVDTLGLSNENFELMRTRLSNSPVKIEYIR